MLSDSDDLGESELCVPDEDDKQVKNLDEFITLGWYCTIVLFAAEFMTLATLGNMVYMVYAGAHPTILSCGSVHFNSTDEACSRLAALRENTGCIPELEYQFHSVNVDFDLLCEDSKSVKNSISIQMFSVLIGALVSGQLSDRFGRKPVLIISLAGMGVFSLVTVFSSTFLQFNILRAIIGIFTGGLSAVFGVYLIENIPKHHRMWINTIVTWSPNFIIYPIIAYFCHDWRNLALFSFIISLITIINLLCLHESPRWLIHHGRIAEARRVLGLIRHLNGKTCEKEAAEIEQMLRFEQEAFEAKLKKRKHYTFHHLVCTWKYFRWTITLCSGLIFVSLVNYGLLFNMEKLSGSLYWNNILFGVVRWAINILVGAGDYFCRCVGRKLVHFVAISFIIGALAIVCALYFKDLQFEQAWVIRYCTIGVTSMTSQLYIAKFMITNELFPTAIRNIAVSALSVSSRVGTIIAPQLFYLTDILPMLPYVVLLIVSIIDCICFQVLLPETKGRNLENHLPPKEKRIFYRQRTVLEE
ncbi:Multispecific organic anion transporter [Trichostrongylus colubriformis]|uniref:Multispecific organic anion transporter n=1 Tax=Trichostrongylus colubriformis TaxID=6319 RepID=A0AAN8FPH5_TRICO